MRKLQKDCQLEALIEKFKKLKKEGKVKVVPGFSRYAVTDQGQIWHRFWQRFLRQSKQAGGYLFVRLTSDAGKKRTIRIHQIVMLTFVGSCPDGLLVRHLDGNPKNNSIKNLEYGTPKENQRDKLRHGTSRSHWLTEKEIVEIKAKFVPRKYTYRMLAEEYKVAASTIYRALKKPPSP